MTVQASDVVLDPVRLRLPRRPVPVLQAAARRGARSTATRSWVSGRCRGTAMCCRASATARRCPTNSACRSTRPRGVRTPPRPCPSWPWTIRHTCGCAPWCPRASPRVASASWSRGSPRSRAQHLDACWRRPAPDTVDYVDEFAGKLPMDVISELMGVPETDRDRSARGPTGSCTATRASTDVPPTAIEASANLIVYYARDGRRAPQEARPTT